MKLSALFCRLFEFFWTEFIEKSSSVCHKATPYRITPELRKQAKALAGNRKASRNLFTWLLVRPNELKRELMTMVEDENVVVKWETIACIQSPPIVKDVDASLRKVKVPTLIIIGKKDKAVASDQQKKMADALPVSKTVIYSDEGHLSMYENPKKIAAEIEAFIKQL